MKELLVFGGAGMVGSRFIELYGQGFKTFAPTIDEFNFLDFPATRKLIEEHRPDAIINFAALTDVEGSEKEKFDTNGLTFKVNALAPKNLAEVSKDMGVHLVHISTEYVFDGEKSDRPYTEEDRPNPINWYGQTKYQAEQFIEESGCDFTTLRIAMPYTAGYKEKSDIARKFLEMLRTKQEIKAIVDSDISPVNCDEVAAVLDLITQERALGVYQAVPTNSTTPYKFACLIAEAFGLDKSLIHETTFDEYNKNKKAKLLRHSWLSSDKFVREFGEGILYSVEEGIELFKKQMYYI